MRPTLLLVLGLLLTACIPLAHADGGAEDRFLSVLVGKGVIARDGGVAVLTVTFAGQNASKDLLLRAGEPLNEYLTLRTPQASGPFEVTLAKGADVLLRAGGEANDQGVVFRLKQGSSALAFDATQEALRVSFGRLSGTLRLQAWGSGDGLTAELKMGEQRSAAPVAFTDGTWILEQRYDTLPGDVPFELRIRDAGGATVASVAGTWDLTLASPRLRGFDPDVGSGWPVQNIGSAFTPAQRGVVGRLTGAAFEEVGQADSEAGDGTGRMVLFGTGTEQAANTSGAPEATTGTAGEPAGETASQSAAAEGFLPQDIGARLVDVGIQIILPLLVLGVILAVVAGKFARRA